MRILVADADPIGRKLVRKTLDRQLDHELIGETDALEPALAATRRQRPDVVVLANTFVQHQPTGVWDLISQAETAIVLVAVAGTGSMVWLGISSGASAYVLKDRLARELPEALVAAETGGVFISPPLAKQLIGYLMGRLDVGHDVPSIADIAEILMPREREVLLRLASGESTEEIASDMSVTTATVRAYVSRMLRKLGVRSRGEAIALAYRSNFYPSVHAESGRTSLRGHPHRRLHRPRQPEPGVS